MSEGSERTGQAKKWLGKWELPFILFGMWLVFISIPISLGHIGLSWDALNHQIYLGWVADQMRFDKDYMAAGSQAYQFPYLYWPVYKLAASGFSGLQAGIVLSTLHLVVVPPVWMISKTLIEDTGPMGFVLRCAAVLLAFMSAVPLKILEATGNDLLAAAPVVWAVALILRALTWDKTAKTAITKASVYAGLLAGIGVAFKFSNGPIVILIPVLFAFFPHSILDRFKWVALNGISTLAGFLLCFSHWGYQLWLSFGNPIYPFYNHLFEPLRAATGWQP